MTISVFGSAYPIEGSFEYEQARRIGGLIAAEGWTVCNGGYGGIMEASARGAREAGGKTLGITSEYYGGKANRYIVEEIRTADVTERLQELIRRADGYIVLPGGTGTLVELATVWEYINKRVMHEKPIVVLGAFWEPVIHTVGAALLKEGRDERIRPVVTVYTPEQAIDFLKKKLIKNT
jgi:uncharacterized protein (TIGR00730 family)